MTKRKRIIPDGYIDESGVKKLVSSFGAVMDECLPTPSEIMTVAVRLIILGQHVRLTHGDPSATTPEIQVRLEKLGDQIRDLIHAFGRGDAGGHYE